jgi:hypothetical protein
LQAVADFDTHQKKKIAPAFNLPLAKLSDEPADLADEPPKEPPKPAGKRILPSWISGSAAKSAKVPENGSKQKGKKRAADEGLEKAEKKARRGEEDRAEEGGVEEEENAGKRGGAKGKRNGKRSGAKNVARKKIEKEESASGEESEEVRGEKRGGNGAARRKKGESDSSKESEGVHKRGGKGAGKAARKQNGDEESDSPKESSKRRKGRSRKAPPTRTAKPPAAGDLRDGEVESGPESEPDNETEPGQPGETALLGGKSVPFEKLLDGVTFAISGIQNPERARLRGQAEEMGAEYRFDWGDDCTLLVCAVKGTPRFKQVNTVNLSPLFVLLVVWYCTIGRARLQGQTENLGAEYRLGWGDSADCWCQICPGEDY